MAKNKSNSPYISVEFDLAPTSKRERLEGRADFYPDRI